MDNTATRTDLETLREGNREALTDLRDFLSTQMREGFEGIHARQDITNGRVGKGEVELGRQDVRLRNMEREVFHRRRTDDEDQPRAFEDRAISRRDVTIVVATLAGAAAVVIFILKILPLLMAAGR